MTVSRRLLGAILLWLIAGLNQMSAQVTTATILGTVTDSTGAIVPGISITIRNVETGITRAVTTDEQGRYRATQLVVGHYEVAAEAAGFQTLVRSGIELTVGREATLDLTLQVGAVSESVTVTGEAPLIESTKAEVAGLVSEKQMSDLPLNGRSYANLATIQAGVIADFHTGSNIERGGQAFVALGPKISINGARPNQAMYLLDGTEINSLRYNNIPGSMAGQLLGVEAVREFTILKNNYGAQYGRGVGGIMNAVTRAGTNQIHGSAFEFFRNSKLDAKNFFDAGDQPIPPFRKNQFGGSIGGPVVKDHTFFMGSYEAIRELVGLTGVSTVPTLESRAGLGPIFGNPSTPVAMDPNVKPFLDLIPFSDPKYDLGNGLGLLKTWRRRPISEDNGMIRYDQQVTAKDSLFGRLSLDRSSMTSYGSGFIKGYSLDATGRYYFVTIGETRLVSNSIVNDFRAGFARNVNITVEDIPRLDPRLGIFPGSPLMDFSIGGGVSVAGKIGSGFQEPDRFIDNTFDFSDNVIFNRGRHSITVGANLKRYRGNVAQNIWAGGVMSFTNFAGFYRSGAVQSTTSLGIPGTWDEEKGWRQTYWATYVQDDFRAMPSLTVNLGVRLERITDPKEVNGRVATILNPCCDTTTSKVGYPWITIKDPLKLLSPRIGLAWTPFGNQKTVIRAAYGIFKEPIGEYLYALYYYTPPIATVYFQNATTGAIPFPYPLGALLTDPRSLNVGSYVFVEPNAVTPYTEQWNFAVQRQLASSVVVTATYIGSNGKHLTTSSNPNQFIPIKTFDPTVGYDRWYTPAAGEPGFGQRWNPNFQAYRMETFYGHSWYHSLQMELEQKYRNGLQYNVSYTWGKNLGDVGYAGGEGQEGPQGSPQNWYDRRAEKSLSTINVKHNFIVSTTYELPVGNGKKFAANIGKIGNALVGGWSFNTILRRRSGLPATPTISFNNSRSGGIQASGSITERPDLKPRGNNNPVLGGPDKYFDATQWIAPPPGRYGNAAPQTIIGPGLFNLDFSLFKGFRVAEGKQIQFRAEFFNVTNHPNFGQPNTNIFSSPTTRGATAGQITETVTTARKIQLALKLTF